MADKPKPMPTYYFSFTPEAKLVVVPTDMPMEDAVGRTGRTIKLFGWREGIMHTIQVLERYLGTHQLENHAQRIKLNSRPKQMPDGRTFDACASCGYSPEADLTMWRELVAALDAELEEPPKA